MEWNTKAEVYAMRQIGSRNVVPQFEEEKLSAVGGLNLMSDLECRSGMLRRIAGVSSKKVALRSQCIPLDKNLWLLENFDHVLQQRQVLVTE